MEFDINNINFEEDTRDRQRNELKGLLKYVADGLERADDQPSAARYRIISDSEEPEKEIWAHVLSGAPSHGFRIWKEHDLWIYSLEGICWTPRFELLFDPDIKRVAQERVEDQVELNLEIFRCGANLDQFQSGLLLLRSSIPFEAGAQRPDEEIFLFAWLVLQKLRRIWRENETELRGMLAKYQPVDRLLAVVDQIYDDDFFDGDRRAEGIWVRNCSEFEIKHFQPKFDVERDLFAENPFGFAEGPQLYKGYWIFDRAWEWIFAGSEPLSEKALERDKGASDSSKQAEEEAVRLLTDQVWEALPPPTQRYIRSAIEVSQIKNPAIPSAPLLHVAIGFECWVRDICHNNLGMSLNNKTPLAKMEDELQKFASTVSPSQHFEPAKILAGIIESFRDTRNKLAHGDVEIFSMSPEDVKREIEQWLNPDTGIFRRDVVFIKSDRQAGS